MRWHEKVRYSVWLFIQGLKLSVVGQSILSVFGALWFFVEILAFFNKTESSESIKTLWWLFLILGIIIIIYRSRPKFFYSFKVKNRDVSIVIQIGDIFSIEGAKVIPINNKLDCYNNGIIQRSNSVLKLFIQSAYNSTYTHLQTDINQKISDNKEWYSSYIINEHPLEFKIGTVLPIYRDEKQYYLLSSST